mgnify:FL=1
MVKRGLFFDSATLYYRAFFAVPDSVRNEHGEPSGAIRGFLDMVSTIINQFPANHIVFAWDMDWRPQWRVDLVPSYKTHRLEPDSRLTGEDEEEVPDDLGPQITAIAQILDSIGAPRLGEPGFEADDILGSLVAQHDFECDVVTGDRDLFQLVSDAGGTRVISITKGVRNLEIVDDAYLIEKYGVAGHQYADFATLRGDASDGLPGVKGIGVKTAADLIATWGTIDHLLDAIEREDELIRPAVARKLLESHATIIPTRTVVQVRTDATVTKKLSQPKTISNPKQLCELVEYWGVKRHVNQLLNALALPNLDSVVS